MKWDGREPSGKIYILHRQQLVSRPIAEVFEFFSRASNLQVLTPPWLDFRIVEAPETMEAGSLIRYKLRIHKLPIRWTTEIIEWQPPHRFVDVQLSGPYSLWHHEHTFMADPKGTLVEDKVRYALPFGFVGRIANWMSVERDVTAIFDYRERKMCKLFSP